MALSVHSALTIYWNPYDLCFYIGESMGRHNVYVSFGPDMKHRPIVTTDPVFSSKEEAVKCIEALLRDSFTVGERERTAEDGLGNVIGVVLDPKAPYLNEALMNRILADLRSDQHQANTYEYNKAA